MTEHGIGTDPTMKPIDPATAPTTTVLRTMGERSAPRGRRRRGVGWLHVPLWLGYLFLYLPIVVVVVMSFNASKNLFVWRGFSLDWYASLFHNRAMLEGLGNTLIVAISVTVISTVLGTLLAVGIHRYTKGA
ncbi:ABC transporter permease [Leucobacter soli]|uniref:ABC transporter permease n=1 Tax=Leucobacter soli TaxID=2812850 RepID=UPI00360AB19F